MRLPPLDQPPAREMTVLAILEALALGAGCYQLLTMAREHIMSRKERDRT